MVDSSYGFDHEDMQDLNNRIARRPGFENWTRFGFWYRESPQEFRADTLGQDIPRYGNATVDLWYPAWSVAGMRGVRLDNAGLLRWFQAIPPTEKGAAIEEKPLEWSTWFTQEMIGFSLEKLEHAEAQVVPSVVYDQVQAWHGKWPGSDYQLMVVAAAFQGRPVYFEILAEPNKRASEPQPTAQVRTGLAIDVVLRFAIVCIAIVLMARNVYLRRWDRRGAWRLAVFVVVAHSSACLLRAHHSWSDWEIEVLRNCWASALLTASITWLNYVALEPTVRRYWPDLLISWTRLLGGRFTDPRIGRDIMLGSVVGLGMCVVVLVIPLIEPQFQLLHSKHRLLSIPLSIGSFFFFAQKAVGGVVFATFVLVFFRIIIRRQVPTVVGAWLLTYLYAALTVACILLVVVSRKWNTAAWIWWHACLVSTANGMVVLYLTYWGIIGVRTWA